MTVTDQPDQELTPEQEEHVRRLLADARHTEPAPDAVVARLDKVLAGLADEPARSADVVHLAHRRRRAATLLVAAAAVVVVGVGLGQVLPHGGGSEDAESTAEDAPAAGAELEDEPRARPASLIATPGSESAGGAEVAAAGSSSQRFARDAARLQVHRHGAALRRREYASTATGTAPGSREPVERRRRGVCEPGRVGPRPLRPGLLRQGAGLAGAAQAAG